MDDELVNVPVARPALGPGDDDPNSPATVAVADAIALLGPGDDDPRSPIVLTPVAPVVETRNPDDDCDFLAPAAPGPGDPQFGPRHLVRFPKKTPPPTAATLNEQEQE